VHMSTCSRDLVNTMSKGQPPRRHVRGRRRPARSHTVSPFQHTIGTNTKAKKNTQRPKSMAALMNTYAHTQRTHTRTRTHMEVIKLMMEVESEKGSLLCARRDPARSPLGCLQT
jgi:hypothetical protein